MTYHSPRRQAPEVAPFAPAGRPLLEAQVADTADSLAYDAHDVDDALDAGLIAPADLRIMAAAMPDCRLVIVPGVGHSMNLEMPPLYDGPDVPFVYTLPAAGAYKMWVQFARASEPDAIAVAPFTFVVSD